MIINEYRVINNCTEEEYQVGKMMEEYMCIAQYSFTLSLPPK